MTENSQGTHSVLRASDAIWGGGGLYCAFMLLEKI